MSYAVEKDYFSKRDSTLATDQSGSFLSPFLQGLGRCRISCTFQIQECASTFAGAGKISPPYSGGIPSREFSVAVSSKRLNFKTQKRVRFSILRPNTSTASSVRIVVRLSFTKQKRVYSFAERRGGQRGPI